MRFAWRRGLARPAEVTKQLKEVHTRTHPARLDAPNGASDAGTNADALPSSTEKAELAAELAAEAAEDAE